MSDLYKKLLILVVLIFTSRAFGSCYEKWQSALNSQNIPSSYRDTLNTCDTELKSNLFKKIRYNKYLNYRDAREYFFSDLDNVKGQVNLVYSNTKIRTNSIPDPEIANCEHSWPQSLGATGKAKSDLHHLFPVRAEMNSLRSNHPYCEVGVVISEKYGSKYGWSKTSKTRCFEPTDSHKGDVSRAMMYFSLRYNRPIDPEQEHWFRKWNKEDKVSKKEIKRNNGIDFYQNNRNPFIDYYLFADLILDF